MDAYSSAEEILSSSDDDVVVQSNADNNDDGSESGKFDSDDEDGSDRSNRSWSSSSSSSSGRRPRMKKSPKKKHGLTLNLKKRACSFLSSKYKHDDRREDVDDGGKRSQSVDGDGSSVSGSIVDKKRREHEDRHDVKDDIRYENTKGNWREVVDGNKLENEVENWREVMDKRRRELMDGDRRATVDGDRREFFDPNCREDYRHGIMDAKRRKTVDGEHRQIVQDDNRHIVAQDNRRGNFDGNRRDVKTKDDSICEVLSDDDDDVQHIEPPNEGNGRVPTVRIQELVAIGKSSPPERNEPEPYVPQSSAPANSKPQPYVTGYGTFESPEHKKIPENSTSPEDEPELSKPLVKAPDATEMRNAENSFGFVNLMDVDDSDDESEAQQLPPKKRASMGGSLPSAAETNFLKRPPKVEEKPQYSFRQYHSTNDAIGNDNAEDGQEQEQAANTAHAQQNNDEGPPDTTRFYKELNDIYPQYDRLVSRQLEETNPNLAVLNANISRISSDIQAINELVADKQREWNKLIHYKKIKEEIYLRMLKERELLMLVDRDENLRQLTTSELKQLEESFMDSGTASTSRVAAAMQTFRKQDTEEEPQRMNTPAGNARNFKPRSASSFITDQSINYRPTTRSTPQHISMGRQGALRDVRGMVADYRRDNPEEVIRVGRRLRSPMDVPSRHSLQTVSYIADPTDDSISLASSSHDYQNETSATPTLQRLLDGRYPPTVWNESLHARYNRQVTAHGRNRHSRIEEHYRMEEALNGIPSRQLNGNFRRNSGEYYYEDHAIYNEFVEYGEEHGQAGNSAHAQQNNYNIPRDPRFNNDVNYMHPRYDWLVSRHLENIYTNEAVLNTNVARTFAEIRAINDMISDLREEFDKLYHYKKIKEEKSLRILQESVILGDRDEFLSHLTTSELQQLEESFMDSGTASTSRVAAAMQSFRQQYTEEEP